MRSRCLTFMGLVAMLVVLVASTASLIVLTMHLSSGHSTPAISQNRPSSRRAHLKALVLLLLSIGAVFTAGAIVVLDFLRP